ncbi:MAG: YlmC/YmxH family sporulation protein [Clostridiales bacterium]|nr:YlmC/YmxH family sporulation protein [Candidatus Apopatocola equi]MCQ2440116.1 YlmC/YmxH family sporulation protein [Oscillospiraceae bacterium]
MELRLQDLRYREVINTRTGQRLGYVSDVLLDADTGRITALLVPGPTKFFGLLGREEDYVLPWTGISRLGEDIILVDGTEPLRRRKVQ